MVSILLGNGSYAVPAFEFDFVDCLRQTFGVQQKPPLLKEVSRRLRRDGGFIR